MATTEETKAAQRAIGAKDDGKFGPASVDALVRFLRAHAYIAPVNETPSGERPRDRLIRWAEGFVGEVDPDEIWRLANSPHMTGNPGGISWCGGFTLAGLVQNIPKCADWTWARGAGFVLAKRLPVTSTPEPGDIVVWRKVPPGWVGGVYSSGSTADTWHHAFYSHSAGTHLWTVDGNVLRSPKEGVAVCERVANYPPSSDYRPAFYSIRDLL